MRAAARRYAETVDNIQLEGLDELSAINNRLRTLYGARADHGPGAMLATVIAHDEARKAELEGAS